MASVQVISTPSYQNNNQPNLNSVQTSSGRSSNLSIRQSRKNGKLPSIQLSPADNRCICYANGIDHQQDVTSPSPPARPSYSPTVMSYHNKCLQERSHRQEFPSLPGSPFVPSSSPLMVTPSNFLKNHQYNNNKAFNAAVPPITNHIIREPLREPNNNIINNTHEKPVCCYCSQCNPTSPKFPFCAACAASSGKLKRVTYKSASISVPIVSPKPGLEFSTTDPPNIFQSHEEKISDPFVRSQTPLHLNPKDHHLLFEPSSNHGVFRRSVPSMPMIIAIFCCLINFCVPGLGE